MQLLMPVLVCDMLDGTILIYFIYGSRDLEISRYRISLISRYFVAAYCWCSDCEVMTIYSVSFELVKMQFISHFIYEENIAK